MSSAKRTSWFRSLGIRSQLVIFFLGAFGILFSLFAIGMYNYITRIHRQEFDAALFNYVVDTSHSLKSELLSVGKNPDEVLSGSEMLLPFSIGETLLQVSDPSGHIVWRSKNLGYRRLPPIESQLHFRDVSLSKPDQDQKARYRMVWLRFEKNKNNYIIQAAVPMILLDRQEQAFLIFLLVSVPLTLFLAGVAGYALSRRAMGPVAAMISKANEIEARHLSERIPVPQNRDEIQKLAITLNGLLNRLEMAFESQEAFIADASHQLKSPLSILKGELEIFRRKERSAEELNAWLESASQEIAYLSGIVEDLLLLARASQKEMESPTRVFRFDERVMECVARLTPLAQGRQIRLAMDFHPENESEQSFEMRGDPELVRAMIENVIENAIKYSQVNSRVDIGLFEKHHLLILEVKDQGAGIPPDALPHVFDRFFRAQAHQNSVSGSGLGLSIVKRVAALHGGIVEARNLSESGGAFFRITLPKQG